MRFGWVGVHEEGLPSLERLLETGAPIVAVITLAPELAARRSAAADYRPLCGRFAVPLYEVASINEPATQELLRSLMLDVLFVIGWSQILRAPALAAARLGTIGAHASLLPHDRGSAPVNWALIRGARRWGNTLMWLAEEVDAGAIIDQVEFPVTPYDTCATLYERVAESNREMLLRVVPRLLGGERPGTPQGTTHEPALPRRRPADGAIDWRADSGRIYDFVRALTRPYPGAFGWLEGRRWTVWQAALLPLESPVSARPGEILGPVVSPAEDACGQLVGCGAGTVALLELEGDDGTVLRGRRLSEQLWSGKTWTP